MSFYQRFGLNIVLSFVALAASAAAASAAGSPEGVWLNDTGRGAIEIKPCDGGYCGHVVWLRDETDVKGCGRQIIGDARKVSDSLYDGGWIYSPEKKRRYDVELKPLTDGTLRVKGYAGSKMFSRTMIWKPAPADLKRCGEAQIDAGAGKPKTPDAVAVLPPPAKPATPAAEAKSDPVPAPNKSSQDTGAPSAGTPSDPAPASSAGKSEPDAPAEVAEAGSDDGPDMGGLADKLEEIQRETGYGLKKTGNGNCRLKVPFVTVDIPCDR